MEFGLRMNPEEVPYSGLAGWVAVEWVAGFAGMRNKRVKIEDIDVWNGPESGRNLAAISTRKVAALCHFESCA
jgi:hypothetical protein